MIPLDSTSSPDLEGTTTTPQEGVGSPDAVVENPVLEGVLLADEKRTNGRSPSVDAADLPFDQGLDARDSFGSRASVSETDADLGAVFSDTDAALVVSGSSRWGSSPGPGAAGGSCVVALTRMPLRREV